MPKAKPLKLYVPEPEFRPGDQPDFSGLEEELPVAGETRRPSIDAKAEDIRDLAYTIIRVMKRDGEAVGEWADALSDEDALIGLKNMMTVSDSLRFPTGS